MKLWHNSLLLCSVLVALTCNTVMATNDIEILSPPDKASVESKLINIVYRINKKSIDPISVMSDYDLAKPLTNSVNKFSISCAPAFFLKWEKTGLS